MLCTVLFQLTSAGFWGLQMRAEEAEQEAQRRRGVVPSFECTTEQVLACSVFSLACVRT